MLRIRNDLFRIQLWIFPVPDPDLGKSSRSATLVVMVPPLPCAAQPDLWKISRLQREDPGLCSEERQDHHAGRSSQSSVGVHFKTFPEINGEYRTGIKFGLTYIRSQFLPNNGNLANFSSLTSIPSFSLPSIPSSSSSHSLMLPHHLPLDPYRPSSPSHSAPTLPPSHHPLSSLFTPHPSPWSPPLPPNVKI